MAYLLQVLTPPNTRLGDCLLPSAKEEVLGRPLMVTTLLLPLSRSLALAHCTPAVAVISFASSFFLLSISAILFVICC